ncbi:MAG: AI-2E family transporter [Pseudomonadota bacterium]
MSDDSQLKKRVMSSSVDVYILLALITLFFYLSLKIISPFVTILIWAVIMAVGLYPVFLKLKGWMGGKDGLAGTVIALIGLFILLGPAYLAVESVIESVGPLASNLKNDAVEIPPPNEAIKEWPLVGERLFALWEKASLDLAQTAAHFAPQIKDFANFLLAVGGGMVGGLLQFALSVIFAAVMLAYADPLAKGTDLLAARLAGTTGRDFVAMCSATIRNVTRGILGVAIIQGGLAAIGFFAIGFPFAGLFAVVTIVACMVQVPPLVIIPAIIYVWSAETTLAATLFTVYMLPVMFSDNILKPVLMARGLETPMVVILIGVIGGTVSSGLLGLFIGPVILAVFYKMCEVWVTSSAEKSEQAEVNKAD